MFYLAYKEKGITVKEKNTLNFIRESHLRQGRQMPVVNTGIR